ncbi:hypothetical protein Agabi119p4_1001 [Agaricus bisporus var. burnettii]|uniref:Mediator of RNA polymerase II transcription subunit 9 n=1 Tax=Agaricus bisporus var. burnettii TaxID=192524 RepID=A0A8H7FBU9_AGABI|nr:hypothetical protein Agabi119p4_1001 [Agaricus bisporus var. burnettii]
MASNSPLWDDHVMTTSQTGDLAALGETTTMAQNPLPVALYQNLLPKLVAVLQLTHQPEGTTTPAAKQALLQATNEFKNALAQAKDLVTNLPGGELLINDQDEVIGMLETLRDRKRTQLERFSKQPLQASTAESASEKMEIDSMASTPAD